MSDMQRYMIRARFRENASVAARNLVEKQHRQATAHVDAEAQAVVECGCLRAVRIAEMFKCYFCGIWFCDTCSKEHFGEEGCQ